MSSLGKGNYYPYERIEKKCFFLKEKMKVFRFSVAKKTKRGKASCNSCSEAVFLLPFVSGAMPWT